MAREFGICDPLHRAGGRGQHGDAAVCADASWEALDQTHRRGFNGSRILVLGVAYKKNVGDVRESPASQLDRID